MNNFGLRLKKLRESRGVSLKELAEAIKTSRHPLECWENGETTIKIMHLIKLAKYFNVTTDYLLGL